MEAQLRPFAVDLAAPLSTADGDLDAREGLLVRVTDGEDVGLGEATPLAGWTEPLADCRTVLERAIETLPAEGPDAAIETLDGAPAARHALALALADLRARRADEPLYRHLARDDTTVDRVPVNAVVGDGSTGETTTAARVAADEGYPAVKVKVGARPVSEDAARLSAVRETVGDDVSLRADANGAWTRVQAYEAFRNLAAMGVDFVEQPLAADDLGGLSGLRGDTVGVAVDETVAATPLSAVLDAGAADVVVCKPQALGGVDRALAVARAAREAGLRAVLTTTVDAVVARTAAVHCAAALAAADPVPACGLATADRIAEDLGPDPAPIHDGAVSVPDAPGLGVEEVWS
jgi:o-succinylbenzoate synthase